MSNITDATCDFGLAQTEAGCVCTLASYHPTVYLHYQIGYCAVGTVTLAASAIMYVRAVKYDASKLQQYNFLFCGYAALTVLIRGADPKSYGHIIPRPIDSFFSDSCTSALYSVYILALGYWATIIQKGAAVVEKPAYLKCLEYTAIGVVWTFYLLYDLSLFIWKGFQPTGMIYMQLSVSACMLGAISTTFLVYGVRVHARLREFERIRKMQLPTLADRMLTRRSLDMELVDENGVPVMTPARLEPRQPKEGHAAKIRKILVVSESLSLIVIAGQMYIAVVRSTDTPVELSCANGSLCDTVQFSFNLLHALQVVCVWVILWCFRGIHKKETVPQPQYRPRHTGY